MVTLIPGGVYLQNGVDIILPTDTMARENPEQFNPEAYKATMAYSIIMAHQQAEGDSNLRLKFDALTSHDITYVGIIQTAMYRHILRLYINICVKQWPVVEK